jgi:hypothetical protein
MIFVDILDDAMYKRIELLISTKFRGEIRGIPENVDEYDSDSDRLGYCIDIGNYEVDTVFLDEIIDISAIVPIKTLTDLNIIENLKVKVV